MKESEFKIYKEGYLEGYKIGIEDSCAYLKEDIKNIGLNLTKKLKNRKTQNEKQIQE